MPATLIFCRLEAKLAGHGQQMVNGSWKNAVTGG